MYVIVSSKRVNRFVQFVAQGSHGMRVEAVSNEYLDADAKLSSVARERLAALGWHAPTSGPEDDTADSPTDIDGSSNYFLDAPQPVPYARLAQLAVATLREVSGIGHPGELAYDAGSTEDPDVSLRFPALGVKLSRRAS